MLKQRFLVQFGSTAITYFIGMISGIIVARVAGPSVVGVVSYGAAYVSVVSFLNGLFGSAHIKLVSEGRDHAECMAVFARLQGMSALVYLIATSGWFLSQKYLFHYKFDSVEVQIVILVSLAAHFLGLYEQYANVVYTANLKQAKANIPTFFRTLFWHLGRIAIVVLGLKVLTKSLAISLSLWNLVLVILIVPYLYKLLREYPLGKYNKELAKEYFKFGIPLLIIVIVNSVTHYADKLFLAYYTDTTQLGYYSAAHSVGGMFMLIAMPVGYIFFPLFSGMIAKGDWAGVNGNIRKYQDFIALFVFPLMCTLAVAGGPALLVILGSRYQPSVSPFIVLLFATYFTLWGLPYGNIISAMGKFYLSAIINTIKIVVFMIAIPVLLAPQFMNLKATGVAINLLILNLTGNGLYLFFGKKHGNIHISHLNHFRHAIVITLTVGGYFLASLFKHQLKLWWIIYIPVFLLVTYAVLIATRLIHREHWLTLLEAVNVKKLFAYVNDEMRNK